MVKTGLEVLLSERLSDITGRRVGILANHASLTRDLTPIADALHAAGVDIVALFGPEHGVRGDTAAGESVADNHDARLGVPVYSLYGKTNKPSAASLRDIDVVLIDVQDVGARFYTFSSTMANVMAACGEAGIQVWVLDRPNPISGTNPEGPVLEPEFSSFVGMFPLPIRHALTIGELAVLYRDFFGVHCDLRVIKMQNWNREMFYDATGLPWIAPSPNMLNLDTAIMYPGVCLLEGTNVSEGRGTGSPFELFGAPWVDAERLLKILDDYKLPGVQFRQAQFTPAQSKWEKQRCFGLQACVTDRLSFKPVFTGVAIVCALTAAHPDDFAFTAPSADGRRFFDLLAGTAALRKAIDAGASPWTLAEGWEPQVARFQGMARRVLLY